MASSAKSIADFRSLLTSLRDVYNEFDHSEAAACRAAIVTEETQHGAQRRTVEGGARTPLAADGMSRRGAQHLRVLTCLCKALSMDETLLVRATTAADGNWLAEIHHRLVAAIPAALFQLYRDCEPSSDEATMLAQFPVSRGAPLTVPHRDRGLLPTIVQAIAKLIIVPLQRSVSYAIPNAAALTALARYAPLVEVGAGTGYWSAVLQRSGVDIVAFDSQPPTEAYNNAFFKHTFTTVWQGDSATMFPEPPEGSGREA